MSAREVIEQIKTLPHAELQQVREFILSEETHSSTPKMEYVSEAAFDQALDHVFETHDELLRKLAQ
ncbi:MAG: hypothetical protein ABIO94_08490 [Opitutaceae bacterium]